MDISSDKIIVRYRNRSLTQADIDFIVNEIKNNPGLGRTALSQLLCKKWGWLDTRGNLKEYPCRDLLLRLEEWRHIVLPPRLNKNGQKKKGSTIPLEINMAEISGDFDLKRELSLKLVETRCERFLWRALMDRFHYLGEGVMCGEHLLYLAYLKERPVAALGWGAASLRNPKRDEFVGFSDFEVTRTNLNLISNNLRYLIFPWVKIPCLGSRILGLNLKRLSLDFENRYGHPLILAETYVDTTRFKGTVYKASNWIYLGQTAGKQKKGNAYKVHAVPKAIYIYPLGRTRK